LGNLVLFVCFVMVIALFVVLNRMAGSMASVGPGGTSAAAGEIDWMEILYPHFSWLAFVVLFAVFVVRFQRNQLRNLWEKQQQLHRPNTVEITVGGVTVSSPVSRSEYRWEGIARLTETRNLFLLYTSTLTFHIFPKRAFAREEEMNGLRNMAKTLIGPERQGFEVVAVDEAEMQKAKV